VNDCEKCKEDYDVVFRKYDQCINKPEVKKNWWNRNAPIVMFSILGFVAGGVFYEKVLND
jgi:hypothetical protein